MKLKIDISGYIGTGKTTVARIIAGALKDHGLSCNIDDPDNGGYPYNARDLIRHAFALREKELEIDIAVTQLRRAEIEHYYDCPVHGQSAAASPCCFRAYNHSGPSVAKSLFEEIPAVRAEETMASYTGRVVIVDPQKLRKPDWMHCISDSQIYRDASLFLKMLPGGGVEIVKDRYEQYGTGRIYFAE